MIRKVLIANRGEIACRIIRTCKRLGVATVALYSDADSRAQHVLQADQAFHLGGSAPTDSYLRGDRIVEIALQCGAQAIHPGFGFLSENAEFADAVVAAGLIFIGPASESMRAMGSKSAAKALMQQAGVPIVPGDLGDDQDPAHLAARAVEIGFPLMIKASAGGGGKGMRIVRSADEFDAALTSAKRESAASFKNDHVLLERYVELPRHIEFQVFGDQHGNVIHLNERECSVQRRFQKIIEETPSPMLTPALREQMGAAAVAAARAVNYVGAGTIEFIVGADAQFYFMEMNTRIQVEHPVTELTHGVDLVEWQLRIAAGEPLPCTQAEVRSQGHAIEARLYAEDPENGFLPGSGPLTRLRLPATSAAVRIDSGVAEGDVVTIFYDPMIAKLIVHGPSRALAIEQLKAALAQVDVVGPKSNVEFLEALIRHPRFVAGEIDTSYLDRALAEVMPTRHAPPLPVLAAAAVALLQRKEVAAMQRAARSADPHSPWARSDGWRLGHHGKRLCYVQCDGQEFHIAAYGADDDYALDCDNAQIHARAVRRLGDTMNFIAGDATHSFQVIDSLDAVLVHDGNRRYRFVEINPFAGAGAAHSSSDQIRAPMPGKVVALRAQPGDVLAQGADVLVMEAMKMELALKAPIAGTLAELRVAAGDFVDADQLLARMEAES